jgi:hypothetical protein
VIYDGTHAGKGGGGGRDFYGVKGQHIAYSFWSYHRERRGTLTLGQIPGFRARDN